MPRALLSLRRLRSMVPGRPAGRGIEEALFDSKAELEGRDGDALTISATPDRLDLLSESGLARQLAARTGGARRAETIRRGAPSGLTVRVGDSVSPLRPCLAAVVVCSAKGIDAGTLDEAIRFQELLHATVGRARRVASLGLYALDRVRGPLRYERRSLESLRFVPLGGSTPVDGPTFFAQHPMAAAYGALGRSGESCLVLADADDQVLSLPPILNASPAGEVRPGDRALLLESTGVGERPVREILGLLLSVFAAQGFSVSSVAVERTGPRARRPPAGIGERAISLDPRLAEGLLGLPLSSRELPALAGRAGLAAARTGARWTFRVPPWRPDLLGPIDLVEDLAIARGLSADEGRLAPIRTRGARLPEARFRSRIAELLLGLGFTPLYRPVLSPRRGAAAALSTDAIEVANPPSEEYALVRPNLRLSLLDTLEHNVRHGYPQRLSEVGPCVVRSAEADSGAETRVKAAALLAEEHAGFADAAALVDYLLRRLGATGVRESAEFPGSIAGRGARVRIAGVAVAEIGEIGPELLTERKIPVPVAWSELDLTALWPLFGRPDAAAAGPRRHRSRSVPAHKV